MELDFIPLDYSAFDFNDENYVKIYGRSREGKRVCVIDKVEAYFWAILKDGLSEKQTEKLREKIERIKVSNNSRITRVLKTEVHDKKFLSKDVKAIKIYITNYKDAPSVADKIGFDEVVKRREHDLGTITRYILSRNLSPLRWHKITGKILSKSEELGGIDSAINADFVIKANSTGNLDEKNSESSFIPKVIAYDIETDEFEIGKGKILMISLYGEGKSGKIKKVLTWKKEGENLDFVERCRNEADMLEKFCDYIKKEEPDILTGYFSDSFDLPYIKERAKKLSVELPIGLDNSQPRVLGSRKQSVKIEGIVHLDIFKFIEINYSQYLQSETLSLNEVASELLGEKKHDFEFKQSGKLTKEEWNKFFHYNLQDSALTFKLAEKIWPDLMEFSRIMNKPLFEISRDGMSTHVEDYILHNLHIFNEIAEKRPIHDEIGERRDQEKYEGAFVLQPKPGLYENVVIFDFTSMYSSVAVTYNFSKSTLLEKKEKDSFEITIDGKKVYFSKEQGFFPKLLEELILNRKKYKNDLKNNPNNQIIKARSNAFKLIANAAYGYQGFFGARYYCREAAASIAAMARKAIHDTIDKVEKSGRKVIYSDTDAVAFIDKSTKQKTIEFLYKLNSELPGIMELDLEDFYKRGLWVTTRSGEFGAKKKYALINEQNKLKIRGFETVRRDWCRLARSLQNEVLRKILNEGNEVNALKYTKEIIKKLKDRKIERKDIIIKTQLKKPISGYKSKGPHVLAAEKMIANGIPVDVGMLIEYYISEPVKDSKGKPKSKRIGDRIALTDENKPYDISYYLNNQVLPSVENIFQVFNIETKDIIEGESQKRLF